MKVRVAIQTLGCRANQYDSDKLAENLSQCGFDVVSFQQRAEIYIVNTCTVTHKADQEARYLLQRAHRRYPEALIIATGCYAQVSPKELGALPGVTYVIGNDKKDQIVARLKDRLRSEGGSAAKYLKRSRAYVKVQEGCNFRCSFCIIPKARGRSKSRPTEEIVQEIRDLAQRGYREVVLTGIHIGSFGWDLNPRVSLLDLMRILEKEKPISRIRLSTLDPNEVSKEMMDLLSTSDLFCPHLHVAIQSGSDLILKKMRRRHTTRELIQMNDYAAKKMKDLGFGADIITGFPSETHKEYEETKKILNDLYLTYLHVFPYSERRGTFAATNLEAVPKPIRKERALELIALSNQKKELFWKSQLNKKRSAILEGGGIVATKALTDNFIPLRLMNVSKERGGLGWVEIKNFQKGEVYGQWLSEEKSENS